MRDLDKIFGRTGNRMFQMAALMGYAKKNGHDIYCQNPKYFENVKDEIKALYSQGIMAGVDAVSIHVRRGDYLNEPQKSHHVLLGMDYYNKAISMFPEECRRFIVFSDDYDWCKKNFKDTSKEKFEFSEGDELWDFNYQASCKHNIIANSSFSYWSAWLNPNPNKIVIAPKKWYLDGVTRTVLPKEWIQI